MKVYLSDATLFVKTCDDFLGGFWGANILKSEQNFKNIRKFRKHNLTNNFVRNLIIYPKGGKKV